MRFSLILLILFYSQIFSQSTLFVKFKTLDNALQELNSNSLLQSSSLNKEPINNIKISSLKNTFGELNTQLDRIIKYEFKDINSKERFISSISSSPSIEYYFENNIYKIDDIQSDSLINEQWGLRSVNAIKAWELIPNDTEEIIIAIIDTGIDYLHPDLTNTIFKNSGEIGIDSNGNEKSTNGIDDDKNGFIDDYQGWDFVDKINIFPAEIRDDFTEWDNNPMDENGHGTNISGIVAAEHNDIGIAGVNPNVKLLNLRAFDKNGNGEEDDAVAAIIYAVKMGAKVINMSWGDTQHSKLLEDVINYAYDNDVVLVGSSGNNSTDEPHYPSGFESVISVGAIQENNALASFSNFGSTLDLVAPGAQIITTHLDGSYKNVSGTSAAAPFVSGASAIILNLGKFNIEETKQILKSTANDLGETGWDNNFGAGNLNIEKALQILSPAIIKFNTPENEFYTSKNSIGINISCLSPYFKSYRLSIGVGYNPSNWESIETGSEQFQILNQDVAQLDITNYQDTLYTLQLLVERLDGKTQEERISFGVDRTAPIVLSSNITSAIFNNYETVQASIVTDDLTSIQLNYRKMNSTSDFESLSLDGFNQNLGNIATKHFGFLPLEEVRNGLDHEIYFSIKNRAGLTRNLLNGDNYFSFNNSIDENLLSSFTKEYTLPSGRIFKEAVRLDNMNNYVLVNENTSSSNVGIYRLNQNNFNKVSELKNKIPVGVADINSDGKFEILSLFVKNGFIDSQLDNSSLNFQNKFSDSTDTFWPAYWDDIDNDERYEIIVFDSDTSLAIWEIDSDFNLSLETKLQIAPNYNSIFRNNLVLVDNFDSDLKKEIVCADNFGRLIIFEIVEANTYRTEKVIEHFEPIESKTTISKGDYDGNGTMDIGILMNFEENVFLTPLTYSSVISLNDQSIEYLFEQLFISTENSFVSSFDKQYSTLNFSDINQNGKDDLILFTYPNSYIFEYDELNTKKLFYQTDVNSQSIFIGDLDNNNIEDIGIQIKDSIRFFEFIDDGLINQPTIIDYFSLNDSTIYFEWNGSEFPVYIFRSSNNLDFLLYDSIFANSYSEVVDSGLFYYSLQFYDPSDGEIISNKSEPIVLFPHAPGNISEVNQVGEYTFEIKFNIDIQRGSTRTPKIIINNSFTPSSANLTSDRTLIFNIEEGLIEGENKLYISGIRDIFNTPIRDTLKIFQYVKRNNENKSLFITEYKILDNNNLMLKFNLSLDSLSALNKINYTFRPNRIVETLALSKNGKEIQIKTLKPFGSIGKEVVLKVENIYSSEQTGNIPISEYSGSEVVLVATAKSLDDIYVYPNPSSISLHNFITFANLPELVDIYIFSIDGKFINSLEEKDANGGLEWDLKNNNGENIGSGIYFYKAISKDNFGNELQEKIGKFAVLK